MFKFSKIVSAVALAVAGVAANAGVVIDDFSFTQATAAHNGGSGNDSVFDGNGVWTNSGPAASSTIIGGFRDFYVEEIGTASGGVSLAIDSTEGWLQYSTTGSAKGYGVVRWDGANTAAGIDVGGLAGENLTVEGAGIALNVITAEYDFQLTFDIWTDKDPTAGFNWVKDSYTTTVLGGSSGQQYIAFTSFGTAVFSNVGAIQMTINGTGGTPQQALDFTVDIIQAVPEPGSLALAGLALAGLGMARRRKAAAK